MILPVKVSMFGSTQFAHTLDLTASGARLGSLRSELKPGEIIVLHRGAKKAKFRISWVRQVNPKEIQAGIEAVEPRENFWGVDLTAEERDLIRFHGAEYEAYRSRTGMLFPWPAVRKGSN